MENIIINSKTKEQNLVFKKSIFLLKILKIYSQVIGKLFQKLGIAILNDNKKEAKL